LPVCERNGLGILPWSPLAAGFLSGKYHKGQPPPEGSRWSVHPYDKRYAQVPDADWGVVEAVRAIAAERGSEPVQVACAWLLSRRALASVLGGANSLDQMKTYIGAADVKLSADEVKRLDDLSKAPDGRPWPPKLVV